MDNSMQNMSGMNNMSEQIIAADFLMSAKTGIKSYSAALAETATPEVRDTLRRHLDIAIGTHERITNYMMGKGYYQAYNPQEQFRMDIQAGDSVMGIQPQQQS